jgi:hypothetical protein
VHAHARRESDIVDLQKAQAREIMRHRVDRFLHARVMKCIDFNLQATPVLDVKEFMGNLPSDLQMEFAAKLGWISSKAAGRSHEDGIDTSGYLYKVPFFSHLDNDSQILICQQLIFQYFEEFKSDDLSSSATAEGRYITEEGHPGADMFVVISGKVAVVQEHIVIGTLETHHFFSEYCGQ